MIPIADPRQGELAFDNSNERKTGRHGHPV